MSRVKDMIMEDMNVALNVLINNIDELLAYNSINLLAMSNNDIIDDSDFNNDMFSVIYDELSLTTDSDISDEDFTEYVESILNAILLDISKQLNILREKAEY